MGKARGHRGRTCIKVAADDVDAMTKPHTDKPAITPPWAEPAQAANAKIATCTESRSTTH